MRRARFLAPAPRAGHPRLRAGVAAVVVAAMACVAPAPASAAGEPEILAAGIDATDRPFVTWRLEPDTTFAFLEFSTIAIANPFLPGSFAGKNVVASTCAVPGDGCSSLPSITGFRAADPVARDRRYFVRVNARKGNGGPLSSAIWVVDKRKPLIPGGGVAAPAPTNTPVLGEPYTAPARRTIPAPTLTVPSPPKTIAAVLRDGVRAQVSCPRFACYAVVGLLLGKTTLVFSDTTVRADKLGAFLFRPRPNRRALLQRRRRARLTIVADIYQPSEKRTQRSRRFSVRR